MKTDASRLRREEEDMTCQSFEKIDDKKSNFQYLQGNTINPDDVRVTTTVGALREFERAVRTHAAAERRRERAELNLCRAQDELDTAKNAEAAAAEADRAAVKALHDAVPK